jgi:hypothetical protein
VKENPIWPRIERVVTLSVGAIALITLFISSGVCTPSWKLQTVAQAKEYETKNDAEHVQLMKSLSEISLSLGRIEGYLKGAKK